MPVTNGLNAPAGGTYCVGQVVQRPYRTQIRIRSELTLKNVPVAETRDGLTAGRVSGCSMKSLTRPAVELLTHALMLS